jgi:hypothetical protein
MARKWSVGLAIGALVLAVLVFGVAQSRADKDSPDLTGVWRLDRSQSELPSWPGGGGGRRNGGWHRGGGDRREGGGGELRGNGPDFRDGGTDPSGGDRRRGRMLPSWLRVTQKGNVIDFADSMGSLVQQIRVGATAAPEDPANLDEVRRLTGRWADGTLQVERTGPRGGTTVQKYKLEDHGRTLVVRTERKDGPDRGSDGQGRRFGPRAVKLVYRRAV